MNRYICIYLSKNLKSDLKKIKKEYQDNLYNFHKRYTKLKIFFNEKYKKIKIKLVGLDGKLKHTYVKFNTKKIIKDIDNMPFSNINKKSLSLYSNYNPKTTIKGLGFKNKEKAKETIKKIKKLNYTYQINVINTMINRAKYHPYINDNMKEAIKIFTDYKKILKKNKKK